MPKVIVPPPYRGPTGGLPEIEVSGTTVRTCVEAVEEVHPGFAEQVCAPDGSLHRFVNVFLNGEKLTGDRALGTEVKPDDSIEIVAAIAGGAASQGHPNMKGGIE